jgi:hypothetical protein
LALERLVKAGMLDFKGVVPHLALLLLLEVVQVLFQILLEAEPVVTAVLVAEATLAQRWVLVTRRQLIHRKEIMEE